MLLYHLPLCLERFRDIFEVLKGLALKVMRDHKLDLSGVGGRV